MSSVDLRKLVSFLDKELALSEFPGDESINGLQVEGSSRVHRIGVAVDACDHVFREAAEKQIDFLLVHHGLIWGGIKALTGIMKTRVKTLLDAGISLYACHLPLDWHPVHGNNSRILKLLKIRQTGEFGEYHGRRIGYWGRTGREMSLKEFSSLVDRTLQTETLVRDFGRPVRNVGVVSGGGWSAIYEAAQYDIDTFLTGEPSHSAYSLAEEMKVNLVFAGHYATETVGVRAVGQMLGARYRLMTEFIDHPTGL
ncbi:MAG: Nif3-like dinuclear metal center hexameric protein [Nitrospirae bacterium]|nr:MAG: Nif3-like dinuclear metal center hexameric protein [Nitrospirota bacterium]